MYVQSIFAKYILSLNIIVLYRSMPDHYNNSLV